MSKPVKILEKGYHPTTGRSVNTANPPTGGSGVPPQMPAGIIPNKK